MGIWYSLYYVRFIGFWNLLILYAALGYLGLLSAYILQILFYKSSFVSSFFYRKWLSDARISTRATLTFGLEPVFYRIGSERCDIDSRCRTYLRKPSSPTPSSCGESCLKKNFENTILTQCLKVALLGPLSGNLPFDAFWLRSKYLPHGGLVVSRVGSFLRGSEFSSCCLQKHYIMRTCHSKTIWCQDTLKG